MKFKELIFIILIVLSFVFNVYADKYDKYCKQNDFPLNSPICSRLKGNLKKYEICKGKKQKWTNMLIHYFCDSEYTHTDKNEYYRKYFKDGTFDSYYEKNKCPETTTDGKCGKNNGKNCHSNYYCSKHGYFGKTEDCCSKNCNIWYVLVKLLKN